MSSTPSDPQGLDLATLASLPKVCLHDHLDGGLQAKTLLELAQEANYQLPASSAQELEEWFRQAADSGSLATYLQAFEHPVALMQTEANLRRVAREHVLALAADGVIYGEVRWAPELHTRQGLSQGQALEAVAQGLMDGMEQVAQAGGRILVNQILCALRHRDQALETVKTALAYRSLGVVGFDLAGPEDGHPVSSCQQALDLAAEHFLPVTLHAGEAGGLPSIRQALLEGRALRLGHGVRITEDMSFRPLGELDPEGILLPGADPSQEILQLGEVAEAVKNRRIVLEVCPSSNLQTGAAQRLEGLGKGSAFEPARTYAEHPVGLLLRAGFAVSINPDNRLMSATSMTREFRELAEHQGFGLADFFEVTSNALLGAFCSHDDRQALLGQVQAAYGQLLFPGRQEA